MRTLGSRDYDVLLTNAYSVAGYTHTDRPIVLYTDALFPSDYAANINPRLANLSWVCVKLCQHVTRKGWTVRTSAFFLPNPPLKRYDETITFGLKRPD